MLTQFENRMNAFEIDSLNKIIKNEKLKSYNEAIDDVEELIDRHEYEVYIGVVDDIIKLKKSYFIKIEKQ